MGVTASSGEQISVGAGELFYKNGDGLWTAVGATKDHNVFRVARDYADIRLNGVVGPLKGIDYVSHEVAELEVTGVELSAEKIALMIPGVESAIQTSADAGGGASTTLADDTIVGQTEGIKVASVAGMTVGDYIRIGASGFVEFRQITEVGTALVGGTGISIDYPLQAAHASTDAVVETDGAGITIITPSATRRLPSSAYHDWRYDVPGLDGRLVRFVVYDGIMSDTAEFEGADDDAMGPRMKIQSRIDPADQARGGWRIEKVPAFATIGS